MRANINLRLWHIYIDYQKPMLKYEQIDTAWKFSCMINHSHTKRQKVYICNYTIYFFISIKHLTTIYVVHRFSSVSILRLLEIWLLPFCPLFIPFPVTKVNVISCMSQSLVEQKTYMQTCTTKISDLIQSHSLSVY